MTLYLKNTDYRHVLIKTISMLPSGYSELANHLANVYGRERPMHPESLRKKFKGDELLDIQVVVDSTYFFQDRVQTQTNALDWLKALNAQFDLHVVDLPPAPVGGHANETKALLDKLLKVTSSVGDISQITAEAIDDGIIEQHEADKLIPEIDEAVELLLRMKRNVLRAVEKGAK